VGVLRAGWVEEAKGELKFPPYCFHAIENKGLRVQKPVKAVWGTLEKGRTVHAQLDRDSGGLSDKGSPASASKS